LLPFGAAEAAFAEVVFLFARAFVLLGALAAVASQRDADFFR
jgi:hypothetical protein